VRGPQDLVGADRRTRPVPIARRVPRAGGQRATERLQPSHIVLRDEPHQPASGHHLPHAGAPAESTVPGVLAVAMPHAPALGPEGDLPSATAQMAVVSRHFPMAITLARAGATRTATRRHQEREHRPLRLPRHHRACRPLSRTVARPRRSHPHHRTAGAAGLAARPGVPVRLRHCRDGGRTLLVLCFQR
jgi:hypothetical protein